MLNRIKRLLEIPEPHRSGMIRRHLRGVIPFLGPADSQKYDRRLQKLAARSFSGKDGPRYLATTSHRTAGIGHALAEYNTGLQLAHVLNLEFLHSSLARPWEEFLGFHSGFTSVESLWRKGGFVLVHLPQVDLKRADSVEELKEKVSVVRHEKPILFMPYDGQNSFIQHTTGLELSCIYWNYSGRRNARILREPGKLNVAVHIRRRNAMDMKNPSVQDSNSAEYRARYIDLDYFKQLMDIILEATPGESVVFHLFSQGTPDGFEPLVSYEDVRLHLDVDQYNTFHNMACADILVTSPSSFSFKAGMLTPGLKLARYPWWHEVPENEEWCRIPEDPSSEVARISDFIKANLPASRENAALRFPFPL